MRTSFAVIFALFCTFALQADIGEMPSDLIKSFPESSGELFSLQENKEIRLEKEILIFQGVEGSEGDITGRSCWKAYFEFSNNSARELTVDTGFPVEFATYFSYDKNGELLWYGEKEKREISELVGDPNNMKAEPDSLLLFIQAELKKYKKNPEKFSYKKEFSFKEYGNSKLARAVDYEIAVNGKELSVDYVLVECAVTREEDDYLLHIKYVFTHKINFKKQSLTQAVCRIYQPAEYLNEKLNFEGHGMIIDNQKIVYKSEYLIGTSGTWKGDIGDFYFLIPAKYDFHLGSRYDYIGSYRFYDIYRLKNYNPAPDEKISVTTIVSRERTEYTQEYYEEMERREHEENGGYDEYSEEGYPGETGPPYEEEEYDPRNYPRFREIEAMVNKTIYPEKNRQKGVTYLNVSSAEKINLVQYTEEGVYHVTTSAEDVFDGSDLTGWATESGGRGEWIEFKLEKDAVGFIINDGFYEINGDFDFGEKLMEYFQILYPEDQEGYYQPATITVFNTVEKITIIPQGKKESKPFFLEKDVVSNEGPFVKINLPKGVYRLKIDETDQVGKYNSSFISELKFSFCPIDIFEEIYSKAGEDLEYYSYPYGEGEFGR
jgi:hypothetical protein